MSDTSFEVPISGGALHGLRAGSGPPALLLHGGAAVPDYLGECAQVLDRLFTTVRYTQRGTPPSGGEPPYTIESHVADAVAVLDWFGVERAWAIGHSWGGHLALHLALVHPHRLLGLLLVDPLGADASVFPEQDANLRRDLTESQRARIAEGQAALPPPERVGVQASIETNRSIAAHFERGTLTRGLGALQVPALFVHGELDPLPVRSTTATAALIPGAVVETIPDCGHFPWLERPGAFRSAVERLLRRR